jgi:TRAP-type uncharacterized transport system fused permease subunit
METALFYCGETDFVLVVFVVVVVFEVTERTTGFPLTIVVCIVTVLPTATSWGSWESVVIVYVVTLLPGPTTVMDCPGS